MNSYYKKIKTVLERFNPPAEILEDIFDPDFHRVGDPRDYQYLKILAIVYTSSKQEYIIEMNEVCNKKMLKIPVYKDYHIRKNRGKCTLRLDCHIGLDKWLMRVKVRPYHFDLEIKDLPTQEITNPPISPTTANSLTFLEYVETVLNSDDDIFDQNRWELIPKGTPRKG